MPVAIVTGGNSGIGRATAVALAAGGFDVGITWHRDENRARSAVAEIEELGPHRIRVNAVAPGQIATRMTGQEEPDEINVPLGRARRAREVGELIAWLASERAAYVTGASYIVDGGLSLIAAEHQ